MDPRGFESLTFGMPRLGMMVHHTTEVLRNSCQTVLDTWPLPQTPETDSVLIGYSPGGMPWMVPHLLNH